MLISSLMSGNVQEVLLSILLSVPGILIALSFHEWAHAFAAYKLGDPTARNLGRMTIDPLRHLDLFGTLMILLVGFGWAKPVPVNPRNFKKPKRDDIIVSLAGVITNFIIAFILTGIMLAILRFAPSLMSNIVYLMLFSAISINISIGIFNLLPIPPLDGYHLLRNALMRKNVNTLWKFEQYSQYFMIAILILSYSTGFISILANFILTAFNNFFAMILF